MILVLISVLLLSFSIVCSSYNELGGKSYLISAGPMTRYLSGIITSTSNKINVSTELLAYIPYTLRIGNTLNESVSIVMSTEISEPISRTAISIGALFIIAGLVNIVDWIKKEYRKYHKQIGAKINVNSFYVPKKEIKSGF